MCLSSPDIPPPPPALQEAKPADTSNASQRKKLGMLAGGSTLLTGPSGIANALNNTGGSTLLGS